MRLTGQCRTALSSLSTKRHFHTSISARKVFQHQQELEFDEEEDQLENFDDEDLVKTFTDTSEESSSAGHIKMRHERHVLYYLRQIELEVPKLVGTHTERFTVSNLSHIHSL